MMESYADRAIVRSRFVREGNRLIPDPAARDDFAARADPRRTAPQVRPDAHSEASEAGGSEETQNQKREDEGADAPSQE